MYFKNENTDFISFLLFVYNVRSAALRGNIIRAATAAHYYYYYYGLPTFWRDRFLYEIKGETGGGQRACIIIYKRARTTSTVNTLHRASSSSLHCTKTERKSNIITQFVRCKYLFFFFFFLHFCKAYYGRICARV